MPARDRATVTDNIEAKLQYEPTVATRNKKLLQANPLAEWELRVEKWRVYYDLKQDEQGPFVLVKGVGLKLGNKVLIGGAEIEL